MAATTISTDASLLDSIRQRMLETGDWERISRLLHAQLEESGFDDDLRDITKERARRQEIPNLAQLIAEVTPEAHAMISAKIREAVLREIEAVLEREVERV